jgi:hypothetical protein
MNHTATITNNTGKILELNMRTFFEDFEGEQLVRMLDEDVYEVSVECYPPQAEKRFRAYCADSGLVFGKTGLHALILPSVEE